MWVTWLAVPREGLPASFSRSNDHTISCETWTAVGGWRSLPVMLNSARAPSLPTADRWWRATKAGYQFFKLLNVAIMAVCGIVGVIFLSQGMRIVSAGGKEGETARRRATWLWVIVYAFVGSQMAWTLRPFIGAPSMEFELFRQLGGNFYTNVFASLGEILGFFVVR